MRQPEQTECPDGSPSDQRQRGQGMIEYGLLIALITIAALGTLLLFGDPLRRIFSDTLTYLLKFA